MWADQVMLKWVLAGFAGWLCGTSLSALVCTVKQGISCASVDCSSHWALFSAIITGENTNLRCPPCWPVVPHAQFVGQKVADPDTVFALHTQHITVCSGVQ
mmetsp:Transcript_142425/g.248429  ORF Transcript_142425/g.248429 Transcript_142425/m.248429 type:complete len:101 (-) Transcript_142425:1463-1765(-)